MHVAQPNTNGLMKPAFHHSSSLITLIFAAIVTIAQVVSAQSSGHVDRWREAGRPYIQNFTPKDYHENPQNWAIVQDPQGIIYVANGHGVLVFDGANWRTIKTPNKSTVLCLTVVGKRIFAGSNNEIGYLEADGKGVLRYHSMIPLIPEKHRNFGDIWNSANIGDTLFFRSRSHLFRFAGEQVTVWQPQNGFHTMFAVNDRLLIRQIGTGLQQLSGDELQLVSGGEMFVAEPTRMMVPFDNSRILIGAQKSGLYIFDDQGITPFQSTTKAYFAENMISDGIATQSGFFAIATSKGGLALVDKAGDLLRVIGRDDGLQDLSINVIHEERPGALWMALNNGITRLEFPASLTRFRIEDGISGIGESIIRHNKRLFVGTSDGLFYLQTGSPQAASFVAVKDLPHYARHLVSVGSSVLATTPAGIFEWRRGSVKRVATGWTASPYFLLKSRFDSTTVFAGLPSGLGILRRTGDQWTDWGLVDGITNQVSTLAEDSDGTLWFGSRYARALKIEGLSHPLPAREELKLKISAFGEEHGLPPEFASPHFINGKIVFATYHGLKRFDEPQQRFVPDSSLGIAFADTNCWIWRLRETENGDVWTVANLPGKSLLLGRNRRLNDGSFRWEGRPLERLNDMGLYFDIFPEDDGVAWIGCAEGIGRYDSNIATDTVSAMKTVIRRIGGIASDSLYFGGHLNRKLLPLNLPHDQNSLFFEYSATAFDAVSANRFQYFLKGFDKSWSDWSQETRKEYTNLPAGDYRFLARAKNVYGVVAPTAEFRFTISTPWYQTGLAYALYLIFFGAFIYGLVMIRVRQLEARNRQLESIVNERTATVRQQADKLQEMDRVKSNFFANISHEFRTPLTLILGPLDNVIKKINDHENRQELQIVQRNARGLLGLINQLLDLSRLESGQMSLQVQNGNFVEFLRGLVISFSSLAEQKDIKLQFICDSPTEKEIDRRFYYDQDKIEKVLFNLLSNAFKFTPKGRRIIVACGIRDSESKNGNWEPATGNVQLQNRPESQISNPQCLYLQVSDTGIGIPADLLPHIFDRFYQVDSGHTRDHQGTGIGLAHTKELVERHYGKINVDSEAGRGTIFVINLPLGSDHLQPEEIVQSAKVATPPVPQTSDLPVQLVKTADDAPEPAPEKGSIILVIDDHPDMRRFIRRQLEPDFQFIEAGNGEAGIGVARDVIPDLIVCDVMMPGMDGYQVCEALKTHQNTSHIPIVLLTAKAGEESKLAGLETGADDYLTKPFSSDELRLRIQNLIETRRKLRERYRKEGLLQPPDVPVTSIEEEFLQRLKSILEAQMEEEDFGVETLCHELGMSERHLQRKIRALTGQRPSELIRDARLERAKTLLQQHSGTVSEIAYAVGFNNLSYFAKCFRERFGITPSQVVNKAES